MSPGLSRSSRPAAAQLARTCPGLVAPNSTLVTSGLVNGKAGGRGPPVGPGGAASPAGSTAGATRGSSSVPAARPTAAPDRYLPLSTPPSRQNETTAPAPAAHSASVISVPSTQERRTRL